MPEEITRKELMELRDKSGLTRQDFLFANDQANGIKIEN
jgi:hypothetical protein